MPIKFQYEFDIVEILCTLKDDSVVHLDPSNGLNIIYGKNGSGKSSFLNALNGETKQVALLIRAPRDDDNYVDSNLLIGSVLEAFSAKCDEAYGIAGLEKLGEDLFLKRTPLEHWAHLSTWESFGDPVGHSLRLTPKGITLALEAVESTRASQQTTLSSIEEDITDEEGLEFLRRIRTEITKMCDSIAAEIRDRKCLPPQYNYFYYTQQDDRSSLFKVVSDAIDEVYFSEVVPSTAGETEDQKESNVDDFYVDTTTLSSGRQVRFRTGSLANLLGDGGLSVDEVLIASLVRQLRTAMESDEIDDLDITMYQAEFIENRSEPLREVFDDPESVIEDFELGLVELLNCDHILLEFDTNRRDKRWNAAYVVKLPESAVEVPLGPTRRFVERLFACLESQDEGVSTPEGIAGAMYMGAMGVHQNLKWGSPRPKYICLGFPQPISLRPPVNIVNLDKPIDLDRIAHSLTLLATRDATVLIQPDSDDSEETVVELPHRDFVDQMCAEVSRILRGLDLGITEMRLVLEMSARGILTRQPPVMRFLVENSPKQLPFESLSFAQQRWIRIVLNAIMAIYDDSSPSLLVADEPDIGIHQGAVRQVLEFLSGLNASSIITSHAAVAFQTSGARLLHLGVSESGERTISEPIISEDVASVAHRLGVSSLDLLALKKLLVVGEGEHDVAIFDGLLGLSPTPRLSQRVLLTAARGAKNLLSTTETRIITDYTDLHVLHVADNVSTERVRAVADQLKDAHRAGTPINRALRDCGLVELRQNASFEERVLYDLLERCAQRRLMERFHVFGLSKKDIIEYLPPEAFGLGSSWDDLRSEHHKKKDAGGERDFKEWLRRERNATISARKIKSAFEQLDHIHPDLSDLLTEFEVLTAVSELR